MGIHEGKNNSDDNLQEPVADVPGIFEGLKWLAYGEIFAVFGLMLVFNGEYFVKAYQDFPKIWDFSKPTEAAIFAAPIILFIELVVLVFSWMVATCDEFDMWKLWLDHPDAAWKKKAAFFGLPVVLGILPAFPNNIVFISGFMMVYSFANYWTQWLCNDHFHCAFQKTREQRMHKVKSDVLTVMEHYWLKRPQLARIATMLFFNSIAFSLAFAGAVQQEPQRHRYQLSAYVILILMLLISEIVIVRWRCKRDQRIEEIKKTARKKA